jgi:DNA-directed RNA polymerase beta subunit
LNLLLSLLVQAVGLVKNLALMAYMTVGCPASPILEFLEEWSVKNITEIEATTVAEKSCTKVFVNGKPAVPLADDLLQCLHTMCYYNNTCDTTGNAYIELFTV